MKTPNSQSSKIHLAVSILIIILGLIHCYFTFCLDLLNTYALWFFGSGMAIIFAGLINLVRSQNYEKMIFHVCLYTNLLTLGLFFCALIIVQDIQVFIGIVLFFSALLLCITQKN
jgi:hypothetical protein